jgi:hypoxia up-regulated 1
MRVYHLCGALSLVALLPQAAVASVLAIDYGTDWIKASLMKPGVPFDVLLNRDSKRKIQSSVAWKNDDRLFAGDAFNLVSGLRTAVSHLLTVIRRVDSQKTLSLRSSTCKQHRLTRRLLRTSHPYPPQR